MMKLLIVVALLVGGCFLLLHSHGVAGGWCIAGAILAGLSG